SIFESDPEVACTSNPIIGIGEEKLGSTLDHLYLASVVTTGMVAAKVMGQDIVVGKSMALRRTDLERMGGFHAARNHLAEDYVLGRKISEIGKKVRICRLPVYQVSQKRSYGEFLNRHRRWAIIHRTAIAPSTYLGQGMMNALPWALLALLCNPSRPTLLAFAACWAVKAMLDVGALRLHRPAFGLRTPLLVLLKDLSIFSAWCNGVFRRTVVWRGNRLRVEHGSLLRPPADLAEEASPDLAPRPALAAASWAKPPRRDSDRTAA
ncbi:MAG TPA: glycosyltransferase, partial [Myxococcales bacterium]|nr:glycosyltransferase [Myxococcales bacterium]